MGTKAQLATEIACHRSGPPVPGNPHVRFIYVQFKPVFRTQPVSRQDGPAIRCPQRQIHGMVPVGDCADVQFVDADVRQVDVETSHGDVHILKIHTVKVKRQGC